jgi:hypothetical protein
MANVIYLKEARERRLQENDGFLKDGYYYRLPSGTIFEAACEGHISKRWNLYDFWGHWEASVNEAGQFMDMTETIHNVRDLTRLSKLEVKEIRKKEDEESKKRDAESSKMQAAFDDMDIPF